MIENCIVESRDTIRANTTHIGTPEDVKIVIEKNERLHYRYIKEQTEGVNGYADYRRKSAADREGR